MAVGPLVLVLVALPLLLLVPLAAGAVAWAVLRPAEGEPVGRARLRRTSGTTAAAATATSAVVLVPGLVLGLAAAELAAAAVVVAGLLHVAVLWCGEALGARPHAARRTAVLAADPPSRLRRTMWRTLWTLMASASAGLLAVLAVAGSGGRAADLLPVAPTATRLVVVPSVVLVVVVVAAVRQVGRRPSEARLHPAVDAAGRARASHRLLRTGAAATCAVLGLLLVATELQSRASAGGDPVLLVLVLGGGLLVVAGCLALLPPPPLPLLPDVVDGPGDRAGVSAGAA